MENTLLKPALNRNTDDFFTAIRAGANPNSEKTEEGKSVLMVLAELGSFSAMRIAIQHGAEVNAVDPQGMTSLMYAASAGNTRSVDVLLINGADLEMTNKDGLNAAELASKAGQVRIASVINLHGSNNGATNDVEGAEVEMDAGGIDHDEPEEIQEPESVISRPRFKF